MPLPVARGAHRRHPSGHGVVAWLIERMPGCGIAGADFERADLSAATLSGLSFEGVDLSGANLENADLRNADLRGATIGVGTVFRNARMRGCTGCPAPDD